jgi:ABC-type lipoprotein export system ATPase subunit
MVTHNLELVRHTDRVVRMAAGKVSDQPSAISDQLVAGAA